MKILGNPIGWLCNFGYNRTGFCGTPTELAPHRSGSPRLMIQRLSEPRRL